MKKKIGIIILILITIAVLLTIAIMFTDLGQKIRSSLYYEYKIEKESITIPETECIKVKYTYELSNASFEIDVTDKEVISTLVNSISNKQLNNESKAGIMLFIMGKYTVDFGNDITLQFDNCSTGYVMIDNKGDKFITQINSKGLKMIQDIIDKKITENA